MHHLPFCQLNYNQISAITTHFRNGRTENGLLEGLLHSKFCLWNFIGPKTVDWCRGTLGNEMAVEGCGVEWVNFCMSLFLWQNHWRFWNELDSSERFLQLFSDRKMICNHALWNLPLTARLSICVFSTCAAGNYGGHGFVREAAMLTFSLYPNIQPKVGSTPGSGGDFKSTDPLLICLWKLVCAYTICVPYFL